MAVPDMQHPARLRWAVTTAWAPRDPEFAFLLTLLPREERDEVNRFMQEADRKRALVSRLMRRAACCAALGLPWPNVTMLRCKGGKPYCACGHLQRPHAPNFNFNVSHEVGAWCHTAVGRQRQRRGRATSSAHHPPPPGTAAGRLGGAGL